MTTDLLLLRFDQENRGSHDQGRENENHGVIANHGDRQGVGSG